MVKWDDEASVDAAAEAAERGGKSKAPVIVAGLVVVLAAVGFLVFRGPSELPKEDLAVFDEAQKLLRSDDYEHYGDAEKKLLEIVKKHPEHVSPMVWLMQLYCAWGEELQWEAAWFKKATEAKAKELGEFKKTIEKTKSRSAKEATQKKFDAAKVELDTLNNAYNLTDKNSVGRLKEAKEWAKNADHTDPTDGALHRAMADYARITNKWDVVETQLGYVKKRKPDSVGLRFITGGMLMERDKKYDDAIKLFEEALAADPAFTKAQYFLAIALDRKGEQAKAADAMKKVLVMSPGHHAAKAYLGLVDALGAAQSAAEDAETAGTAKEQVAAGDEVAGPASPAPAETKPAPKPKKKQP